MVASPSRRLSVVLAIRRVFLFCFSLLFALPASATLKDDYLPPEQAFVFSARVVDGNTVALHWDIAPGTHLYRERISIASTQSQAQWAALLLPAGEDRFDPNFNKTMAIFEKSLDVDVHFSKGSSLIPLTVNWQGCADAGLCYAPASADLQVALTGLGASTNRVVPGLATVLPTPVVPSVPVSADPIAAALAGGNLLRTLGVFWLAGLLLSFTPCVLPMVPILSSLIAGQARRPSRLRGFLLSLAYTLGMALVYAGFGVAAGLAGEGLAAALQNPWVLGGFALLLTTLALSMFGLYELQMPTFIQQRATGWSNRFKGGSTVGVFLMGGVSALVVGPCVAAPLAGALVYISQTGDVVLGGLALFAMALGMGVPLLLVGLSAGSLLPRAGAWMERVRQLFGLLLLGVAIWIVAPVLPVSWQMVLWAGWLLAAAAWLGLFGSAQHGAALAGRAAAAGLTILSVILLVGAASGGRSVLQPLAHWRGQGVTADVAGALHISRVASRAALDAALVAAHQQGQAVMLDFYADWCVACKEFDSITFRDPAVQKRLAGVRVLQVDVTANTAEDKALLKRFSLFGPPGMVFFGAAEAGRVSHKVIGYQAPDEFLASLDRAAIP
ncbi:protein-disulfide reductase DsbD [Actimicrobium sp. CCI2.3]|uniref:protein-disulfide reductase DsbD n=1 Tax=Actimicrobium sp. CCI2.3 TaxID=3048616 RepID=UPI002B2476C8|nr:protein-disulfide reductase DsbD [Actimicrobium sp. CCI2.3]MEB0021601.1 protein-disulfide reductase DsbD [Actimicrobium sp. CCI2.3]